MSSGPATWPTRANEVPSAWLAGLRAACAAEVGPRGDEYDAIGRMLVVLTVLGRDSVPEGDALWFAMKDEALEAADEFDSDWTFTLTDPDQLASVVALLHAFGAVDAGPVLAPLGRWAAGELRAALPGLNDDLTATEMIAKLAKFDEAERRELVWEWMAERNPEEAAREILRSAVPMSPLLRWVAADVTELLGRDALPVWGTLGEPLMAVHARCALHAWDEGPKLTESEWLWLAAEERKISYEYDFGASGSTRSPCRRPFRSTPARRTRSACPSPANHRRSTRTRTSRESPPSASRSPWLPSTARPAVLAGRLPPAASLWVSSGPRLPSPGPPARPSRSSCPDAASRSPSVPVRRWVAGSPHLFEEDGVPLQNSPQVL